MTLILSGTDGVSDIDGTAATPAIRGTDPNTGIFFPAADTIAFAEGGVEAMRIDSSGNVGIGTSSPQTKLSAVGEISARHSANDSILKFGNNGTLSTISATYGSTGAYTPICFLTSDVERMRIDSSGNVGIGTTSPAQKLDVTGGFIQSTNTTAASQIRASNTGGLVALVKDSSTGSSLGIGAYSSNLYSDGAYPLAFWTNGTERMRIDSSGNVGIGTASPVAGWAMTIQGLGSGSTSQLVLKREGSDQGVEIQAGGGTFNFTPYDGSNSVYPQYVFNQKKGSTTREVGTFTQQGYFKASNSGTYASSTGTYHELRNSTGSTYIAYMQNTSTDPLGLVIEFNGATPNGTANRFIYMGDATTMRAEFRSNGGLANYSANNVNLASDQRLKKDISPLDTSWDKVKAIEVVNFRYKDCNEGDPLLYGVIAQQVQPIVPELVVVTQKAKEAVEAKEAVLDEEGNVVEPAVVAKEATPEYFGIREQPMYWLAIKALQEAMARIEALEAEVAALKGAN